MDYNTPIVSDPIVTDLISDVHCVTVPTGDVSDAESVTSFDLNADDSGSRDEDAGSCDGNCRHSNNGDDVYIDDINNGDFRVVTEYRAILSHFHDLPKICSWHRL